MRKEYQSGELSSAVMDAESSLSFMRTYGAPSTSSVERPSITIEAPSTKQLPNESFLATIRQTENQASAFPYEQPEVHYSLNFAGKACKQSPRTLLWHKDMPIPHNTQLIDQYVELKKHIADVSKKTTDSLDLQSFCERGYLQEDVSKKSSVRYSFAEGVDKTEKILSKKRYGVDAENFFGRVPGYESSISLDFRVSMYEDINSRVVRQLNSSAKRALYGMTSSKIRGLRLDTLISEGLHQQLSGKTSHEKLLTGHSYFDSEHSMNFSILSSIEDFSKLGNLLSNGGRVVPCFVASKLKNPQKKLLALSAKHPSLNTCALVYDDGTVGVVKLLDNNGKRLFVQNSYLIV